MTSSAYFAHVTEVTKADIPYVKGIDIERVRCCEVWKIIEAIRRYDGYNYRTNW